MHAGQQSLSVSTWHTALSVSLLLPEEELYSFHIFFLKTTHFWMEPGSSYRRLRLAAIFGISCVAVRFVIFALLSGTHIYIGYGNISKTVHDRNVVAIDY